MKRVVKLTKDTIYTDINSSDNKKSKASLFLAYCLSGIVGGGVFHKALLFIPDDRTSNDLIAAAIYFQEACSDGDERNSMYLSHAKHLSETARTRFGNSIELENDGDGYNARFYPGLWVCICGFTSPTGLLLNQKSGLICGINVESGRYIVQVKDNNESYNKKLLLSRNFFELPVKNDFLAVFFTMEVSAQWTYLEANI